MATVEELRRQLAERDAELRKVKAELQLLAASSAGAPEGHGSPDHAQARADNDNGSFAVGGEGDMDMLRKQLNEANQRWRREERRAKAREEELVAAAKSQTEALEKQVEDMKAELSQSREKVREATRKRAQLQADHTAAKAELEELRAIKLAQDEKIKSLRMDLDSAEERADNSQVTLATVTAQNEALKEQLVALQKERDTLASSAAEKELAIARAKAAEARAEASDEKINSLKQTMRHNAQLVKDLKAELSKAMSSPSTSTTVSTGAPEPPDLTPMPSNQAIESERLIHDLAARLEALLKENAIMNERVKYLEGIIQSLTAELNSYKNREGTLTPARPGSGRGKN